MARLDTSSSPLPTSTIVWGCPCLKMLPTPAERSSPPRWDLVPLHQNLLRFCVPPTVMNLVHPPPSARLAVVAPVATPIVHRVTQKKRRFPSTKRRALANTMARPPSMPLPSVVTPLCHVSAINGRVRLLLLPKQLRRLLSRPSLRCTPQFLSQGSLAPLRSSLALPFAPPESTLVTFGAAIVSPGVINFI